MSDREKLVVLIMGATYGFGDTKPEIARKLADYLLANGVTVQKHGRWEKSKYIEAPVYVCSECGNREPLPRKFCPECGVMMETD